MKPFVVIGTSGSPDYLNDKTGSRRFWPVSSTKVPPSDGDKMLAALRALAKERS